MRKYFSFEGFCHDQGPDNETHKANNHIKSHVPTHDQCMVTSGRVDRKLDYHTTAGYEQMTVQQYREHSQAIKQVEYRSLLESAARSAAVLMDKYK